MKKGSVKPLVACKDCGNLRKHYGKGLCTKCYHNQWAKSYLTYKHKYLGRVDCPKDGKRGEIIRIIVANKKTGNQWTRYCVRHAIHDKARYKLARKQGLSTRKAKVKAQITIHCTDVKAVQVRALGLTP